MRFLTEHSLCSPGEPLKEHQIATLGLGRRADFDPASDSTVRVQVGRLRNRLETYYLTLGQRDPVIIEIPRGVYSVAFTYRAARNPPKFAPVTTPTPTHPITAPVANPAARRTAMIVVLCAVCVLTGFAAASLLRNSKPALSADLQEFWRPFLEPGTTSLVIYPTRKSLPGEPPDDSYTGVGEVMGAVELTRLFSAAGHPIAFHRASIAPWQEARTSNLIFLGSASLTLQTLPAAQKFALRQISPDNEPKVTSIVNLQPERLEPANFGSSQPCCKAMDVDYALVVFSDSLVKGRSALSLAGLSTLGTQAAVEFLCDPESVAKLRARLSGGQKGRVPFFEAVLKVTIRGGAPIRSELAALYKRRAL